MDKLDLIDGKNQISTLVNYLKKSANLRANPQSKIIVADDYMSEQVELTFAIAATSEVAKDNGCLLIEFDSDKLAKSYCRDIKKFKTRSKIKDILQWFEDANAERAANNLFGEPVPNWNPRKKIYIQRGEREYMTLKLTRVEDSGGIVSTCKWNLERTELIDDCVKVSAGDVYIETGNEYPHGTGGVVCS